MNGVEHKREAERLIALADGVTDPTAIEGGWETTTDLAELETRAALMAAAQQQARDYVAIAQVHATLALVPEPLTLHFSGIRKAPRPAESLPVPRGGRCALGCGLAPGVTHGLSVHDEAGCTVEGCDCPAPFGRIMPQSDVPDDASSLTGDGSDVTS